ncbi:MAG: Asp-tRNA(Asn)/Glu-tRNA(Gln) amidotransferase GatCAB subunit A [Candidatus Vogelbacteria bacterium CG10_big_fil_rev_8_21_14_0_10_50_13]|uniref:Glutamyl-tRNA(Gln) amidotransferase subunit A n=1 Tax=Candidatus Vogelbacteria bacterium CG10_big_fil_rev_8_21_14_0_10_50_13 TaxID=1975044 RepID=A0A2H0RHL7_9BACT|nr:MAG: Asp-tRNA(Asn)/Glu-tRNA(Gln) amidotransferase GatCAB subunit A [Candidatus Vogelbacteria bacterium CG10_big_fil_rev_8_21_14_0_10_50_13]
MAINLEALTIKEAAAAMRAGEFSVRELTQAYLDAIAERNPTLNAYLEVFDDCLEQADKIDAKRQAGEELGELAGIPMAIKDNILIKGRKCSSASKLLENYIATYDAFVIEKLKTAGVVFLGRTNMDEFAMGGSTENSAFGPTKNPHDPERVPGGSSGGSAAAVGGNLALAALGSDTGGSIREPASFCGVVGFKPTYGAVSRRGVMAMASSLDQVGPIAKTIDDAKLVFDIIRGKDELDATSWSSNSVPGKNQVKTKMKIGVPREFVSAGLNPEVAANFEATLAKLKTAGHEVVDIELPSFKYALACYYVLMPAEASTNLARFDGLRYGVKQTGADLLGDYQETRGTGFGPEVRRRIILGTYVLSAGYADEFYYQAVAVQRLIKADYARVFEEVDVIATPTAPGPAFKIGEKIGDPLAMYLEDIFTVPVNIGGVPAVSVPSGQTTSGLPLGVQLTAGAKQEEILFALGRVIAA